MEGSTVFIKKSKEKEVKRSVDTIDQEKPDIIKYSDPKIMLVDVDEDTQNRLREEGFNIEVGTFGRSYKVERDEVCGLNGHLPFITEKDVVIVKLNEEKELNGSNPALKNEIRESYDRVFVTPRGKNYFDGRAAFADLYKNEFKQVLNSGGILIVFADGYQRESYYISEVSKGYIHDPNKFDLTNYQWIPSNVYPHDCVTGKEVLIDEKAARVASAIINGSENSMRYTCEFMVYEDAETYVLLKNRLGKAISYIQKIGEGFLMILPRFDDYYMPISNLIKEILPELKPDLFADFSKNKWLENKEYSFPEVKNLMSKQEEIINEYEEKLKAIQIEIKELKKQNEFLTNILVSQGFDDFLVENVKSVFEYIGYSAVVDVDEITVGNRQEDLRILDGGRFTVVEVKGHKGNPTEDDCQALNKYISRNMKAEKRTDIHGILVVNHQRMLPPAERNYPGYTREQIADAERDDYTLVTTWELFNAVRLLQEGLVTFEDIDESLHTSGLFKATPSNWKYIGKIEHIFNRNHENNIACFYLKTEMIRKGDTIVIENENDFYKQEITEMMIDNKNVELAQEGDQLAIKIFNIISKQAQIYLVC